MQSTSNKASVAPLRNGPTEEEWRTLIEDGLVDKDEPKPPATEKISHTHRIYDCLRHLRGSKKDPNRLAEYRKAASKLLDKEIGNIADDENNRSNESEDENEKSSSASSSLVDLANESSETEEADETPKEKEMADGNEEVPEVTPQPRASPRKSTKKVTKGQKSADRKDETEIILRWLKEAERKGEASEMWKKFANVRINEENEKLRIVSQRLTKYSKKDNADHWINMNDRMVRDFEIFDTDDDPDAKWPRQKAAILEAFSESHIKAWAEAVLNYPRMTWDEFKARLRTLHPKGDRVREGRMALETMYLHESNSDIFEWCGDFEAALFNLQEDDTMWEYTALSVYILAKSVYPEMSRKLFSELEKNHGMWSFREAVDLLKVEHEQLRRQRADAIRFRESSTPRGDRPSTRPHLREQNPRDYRTPREYRAPREYQTPRDNYAAREPVARGYATPRDHANASVYRTPRDNIASRESQYARDRDASARPEVMRNSTLQCYECNAIGHIARLCPKLNEQSKAPARKDYNACTSIEKEIRTDVDMHVGEVMEIPDEFFKRSDQVTQRKLDMASETHERIGETLDVDELTRNYCPAQICYVNPKEPRKPTVTVEIDDVIFENCLTDLGSDRTAIGSDVLETINERRHREGKGEKELAMNLECITGIHGRNDNEEYRCTVLKIKWQNFISYERALVVTRIKGVILGAPFLEAAKGSLDWNKRTMTPRMEGTFKSKELSVKQGIPLLKTPELTDKNKAVMHEKKLVSIMPHIPTKTDKVVIEQLVASTKIESNNVTITSDGANIYETAKGDKDVVIHDDGWRTFRALDNDPEENSAFEWNSEEAVINPKCTEKQKRIINELLERYECLFDGPGVFNGFECKIELKPNHQQVKRRPYQHDPPSQKILDDIIKKHIEKGYLRDATGEYVKWATPALLSRKFKNLPKFHPDQKHRLVCDYRELNEQIESYPTTPMNIKEIFAELSDSKFFCVFDMPNAFHQIKLEKSSQECTAIITTDSTYVWNMLPQGLKTATSIFQEVAFFACKAIPRNENGYRRVISYIDDVIITGNTFDEVIHYMTLFFEQLKKYDLRLSREKMKLFHDEIKFLGQIISDGCIRPNPEKVQSIIDLPIPKTLKELRRCVGLINYLSGFIRGCAEMVKPLHDMTKGMKDRPKSFKITMSQEAIDAFERIKKFLTTENLGRAIFDPERNLLMMTDASQYAIGGIIFQEVEDDKKSYRILATHSRLLTPYEVNRHVTEKECLAILDMAKAHRSYLLGCKGTITVKTDHCALCYLHTMRDINYKLTRWAIALSPFAFKIEHISGNKNIAADHLSRYNVNEDDQEEWDGVEMKLASVSMNHQCVDIFKLTYNTEISSSTATGIEKSLLERDRTLRREEMKSLKQRDDPLLRKRIEQLVKERPGQVIKRFKLIGDMLYRAIFCPEKQEQKFVVCIGDEKIRRELWNTIHKDSHQGCDQAFIILSRRVYWPRLYEDIARWTMSCDRCQKAKEDKYAHRVKAQLNDITSEPCVGWCLDFAEISKSNQKGNARCFICAVDMHSRLTILKPMASQASKLVIAFVEDQIINKHGYPKLIRTDNGSAFASKAFKEFCKERNIVWQHNIAGHSTGNSIVEAKIGTVKNRLRTLLADGDIKRWNTMLAKVEFEMNVTVDANLKKSPFEIAFKREPRLLIDNNLPLAIANSEDETIFLKRMDEQLVRIDYDMNSGNNSGKWKVGDMVLLRSTPKPDERKDKLKDLYNGPFEITNIMPKGNVMLRNIENNEKKAVHESMMKCYHETLTDGRNSHEGGSSGGDRSSGNSASIHYLEATDKCEPPLRAISEMPDKYVQTTIAGTDKVVGIIVVPRADEDEATMAIDGDQMEESSAENGSEDSNAGSDLINAFLAEQRASSDSRQVVDEEDECVIISEINSEFEKADDHVKREAPAHEEEEALDLRKRVRLGEESESSTRPAESMTPIQMVTREELARREVRMVNIEDDTSMVESSEPAKTRDANMIRTRNIIKLTASAGKYDGVRLQMRPLDEGRSIRDSWCTMAGAWSKGTLESPRKAFASHYTKEERFIEDREVLLMLQQKAPEVYRRFAHGLLKLDELIEKAKNYVPIDTTRPARINSASHVQIAAAVYRRMVIEDMSSAECFLNMAASGNVINAVVVDKATRSMGAARLSLNTSYFLFYNHAMDLNEEAIIRTLPAAYMYMHLDEIRYSPSIHSGWASNDRRDEYRIMSRRKRIEAFARVQAAGPYTRNTDDFRNCPLARTAVLMILLSDGHSVFQYNTTKNGNRWYLKTIVIEERLLFNRQDSYRHRFKIRVHYFSQDEPSGHVIDLWCAVCEREFGFFIEDLPWYISSDDRQRHALSERGVQFWMSGLLGSQNDRILDRSHIDSKTSSQERRA